MNAPEATMFLILLAAYLVLALYCRSYTTTVNTLSVEVEKLRRMIANDRDPLTIRPDETEAEHLARLMRVATGSEPPTPRKR